MAQDRNPRSFRPSRRQRLWVGLGCALLAAAASAQKVSEGAGGRAVRIVRDSAAPRTAAVVYEGLFSYVRIERAEAAAPPSRHPVSLNVATLRKALAAVEYKGEPLFNDAELDEITPPLSTALGRVGTDQDVSFAVSGRHSGWVVGANRSVTTGRLFQDADGLQLIVGLAHRPFESEFNATGVLIPFEPGRRVAPVEPSLKLSTGDPATVLRRGDWVSLAIASKTEAPAPAAAGSTPALAAAAPVVPRAAQPAAPAASSAAAPRPAASSSPRARDAAYLTEQENRLRTLRRLRDSNLITEEEFQRKRKEVIDAL